MPHMNSLCSLAPHPSRKLWTLVSRVQGEDTPAQLTLVPLSALGRQLGNGHPGVAHTGCVSVSRAGRMGSSGHESQTSAWCLGDFRVVPSVDQPSCWAPPGWEGTWEERGIWCGQAWVQIPALFFPKCRDLQSLLNFFLIYSFLIGG